MLCRRASSIQREDKVEEYLGTHIAHSQLWLSSVLARWLVLTGFCKRVATHTRLRDHLLSVEMRGEDFRSAVSSAKAQKIVRPITRLDVLAVLRHGTKIPRIPAMHCAGWWDECWYITCWRRQYFDTLNWWGHC